MSDIVNWLRFISDDDGMAPCKEAAAEIERLRSALLASEMHTLNIVAKANAVEAQVAALREALALFTCDCAPKIECADPSYCRNSIARAALAEKG